MANSNKTKAEILQELESIKGLLLENEHIPILQDISAQHHQDIFQPDTLAHHNNTAHSIGSTQTSLFEEAMLLHEEATTSSIGTAEIAEASLDLDLDLDLDFTSTDSFHKTDAPSSNFTSFNAQTNSTPRSLVKASGENPFLPQHIRERLHGNNPPPLFEYETAKKIVSATKNIQHKINKPRQHLIDEVVGSIMPQIESELRHRLYTMSVEDLTELLQQDEE